MPHSLLHAEQLCLGALGARLAEHPTLLTSATMFREWCDKNLNLADELSSLCKCVHPPCRQLPCKHTTSATPFTGTQQETSS